MKKRTGIVVLVIIGVLVLIQLMPVRKTNPMVESDLIALPEVKTILKKSCYDCHSHETIWPGYSKIAPISWLIAAHVNEGREYLNFSVWNRYDAKKRLRVREEIWDEVSRGAMPLKSYLWLHSQARLTQADRQLLQTWATEQEGDRDGMR